MNILHVAPAYHPAYRYGGPIWTVHGLNRWLVAAGAKVTVYTTNADGAGVLDVPTNTPVDVDGVTVFYFPRSFPRVWFYSGAMRRALAAHVHEFDVVHITSVFLAASTLGAGAARRAGRPYVISPRGSLMRETLAKKSALRKRLYLAFLERRNLARAAAIHFTTDIERDEYVAAGLPLPGTFVVPNGIEDSSLGEVGDTAAFRVRNGIAPDAKVILSFGRVSWKKGFDTLIPAFARVLEREPKAVLLIGGNDDEGYGGTVRALMEEHGVERSVKFLAAPGAAVVGAEKAAMFRTADVFALPSYAENFAIVLLEAMQEGKPVVISQNVGLARDVAEAGAGLVVPKDERAVADALVMLLANGTAAHAMGERGRALAKSRFAWPAIAKRLLALYTGIV
jgi:glycosyltransferase involved in cell wall biosynthesis